MTLRQRNLFVLLLVAGLFLGSLASSRRNPTRQGLDLKGGISLDLPGQADQAADGHAERSSTRSTSCAAASTSSASPSPRSRASAATRSPSACRASRTSARAEQEVGKVAQMYFYDWEANVLNGQICKPTPNQRQPGPTGPARGIALRGGHAWPPSARRCRGPHATTNGVWYGVDTKSAEGHLRPERHASTTQVADCDAALKLPRNRKRRRSPGTCRSARARCSSRRRGPRPSPSPDAWYVLNDNPALDRHRHPQPAAELRPDRPSPTSRSASPAPATRSGSRVTRNIADRARSAAPARSPAGGPPS